MVAPRFDEGEIVHVEYVDIDFSKSVRDIADELLQIEHEVQMIGRRKFATGDYVLTPVPNIAQDEEEAELLTRLRKESRVAFPTG